jgi:hypothetical protein
MCPEKPSLHSVPVHLHVLETDPEGAAKLDEDANQGDRAMVFSAQPPEWH